MDFILQPRQLAVMILTGWVSRYLLMDRDSKFCRAFRQVLKEEHVEPVLLPARTPTIS